MATPSPLLFGQFDIAPLYRQIANSYTADLGRAEGSVLFASICLSTVHGGVVTDPATMLPADLRLLYMYCAETGSVFYDAAERLIDNELLRFTAANRERVYMLHPVVLDDVQRAQRKYQRPVLIVGRNYAKEPPRTVADIQVHDNPRAGYVYIAAAETGLFKIGKSRNPKERVKGFAGAVMPFQITLLHAIFSADMHMAESMIHQQYKHCRRAGEWFQLSDKELDELLSMQVFGEAA